VEMPVEPYGQLRGACPWWHRRKRSKRCVETKKGVSGREKESGPKKLEVKQTQERKHERLPRNTANVGCARVTGDPSSPHILDAVLWLSAPPLQTAATPLSSAPASQRLGVESLETAHLSGFGV
jgi:hypothetical protein